MEYAEYCNMNHRAQFSRDKALYDAARQTVAAEIAALFGVSISDSEGARFLTALEKAAEAKEA